MAFTDQYAMATNATFKQKVQIAMCSAALAVVGETPTSKNVKDEKRHKLGVAILQDGGVSELDAFCFACGGYGTLSLSSTDNDIQFVVNSIFSDVAGVSGAEA